MTALEKPLMKVLQAFASQNEQAHQQHPTQVETLRLQVSELSGAIDALGPRLWAARGEVVRALEVMRHRGRPRAHGPSRGIAWRPRIGGYLSAAHCGPDSRAVAELVWGVEDQATYNIVATTEGILRS